VIPEVDLPTYDALGNHDEPEVLHDGLFRIRGIRQPLFRDSSIHPERIMAPAIGAPGGWPIAPVAEWLGHDMTHSFKSSDACAI
jgi:hypothetical protein